MKKITLTFLLLISCLLGFSQKQKTPEIKVIRHNAKVITYFSNGKVDDFGTDNRIVFFKDVVLYEIPTLHYEADGPSKTYWENDSTLIDTTARVHTKTTYQYYVIKKGDKTGLRYAHVDSIGESFVFDSLLNQTNMGAAHQVQHEQDRGTPTSSTRKGKVTVENFVIPNKETQLEDTLVMEYDLQLMDLDFSLSNKMDAQGKGKLRKAMYTLKMKPIPNQRLSPLKLVFLDEIKPINPSSIAKSQMGTFQLLLKKFDADHTR